MIRDLELYDTECPKSSIISGMTEIISFFKWGVQTRKISISLRANDSLSSRWSSQRSWLRISRGTFPSGMSSSLHDKSSSFHDSEEKCVVFFVWTLRVDQWYNRVFSLREKKSVLVEEFSLPKALELNCLVRSELKLHWIRKQRERNLNEFCLSFSSWNWQMLQESEWMSECEGTCHQKSDSRKMKTTSWEANCVWGLFHCSDISIICFWTNYTERVRFGIFFRVVFVLRR